MLLSRNRTRRALLTTTMVNMKAVIEALAAVGLRDKVRVMVGGAPVTDTWAHSIGADVYGKDAMLPWNWRGSSSRADPHAP